MNPSVLFSPDAVKVSRIRRDIEMFTGHRIVSLFGHTLLQTTYEYRPGSIARLLAENQALSPEGQAAVERFSRGHLDFAALSLDEWDAVAYADGLPSRIPVSVWATRTIKRQRAILADAVWNDKLFYNVCKVLTAMEVSLPGDYRPPLFEGPPGASKTYSILVAAALLGRPAMVVVGDPNVSPVVDRELLRGGDGAAVLNRTRMISDQAFHGIFAKPAAQACYYRAIRRIMESSGTDSFETAHDILARSTPENAAIWSTIADLEGIGREGSIASHKYGKAEIGRRNGAVVILDEVNVFNPFYHTILEEYLSSKEMHNPINTQFAMTANPPTEENVNRSHLTFPLLDRSRRITVPPLSAREYGQIVAAQLGVSDEYMVSIHGREVPVREEIARVLAQEGLSPAQINELAPPAHGKFFVSGLLGREAGTQVATRLGAFHAEIELHARRGGDLHAASYGLEQMPDTASFRRLQDTLKLWDNSVFNAALAKANGDIHAAPSCVDASMVAEGLVRAIETNYVEVFDYSSDLGDIDVPQEGLPSTSSATLVREIQAANHLTLSELASVITVTSRAAAQEAARSLTAFIFGQNGVTEARVHAVARLIGDKAADERVFYDADADVVASESFAKASEYDAVPDTIAIPLAESAVSGVLKAAQKNGFLSPAVAIVLFTEKGPFIAHLAAGPGGRQKVAARAIALDDIKRAHNNAGIIRIGDSQMALAYHLRVPLLQDARATIEHAASGLEPPIKAPSPLLASRTTPERPPTPMRPARPLPAIAPTEQPVHAETEAAQTSLF